MRYLRPFRLSAILLTVPFLWLGVKTNAFWTTRLTSVTLVKEGIAKKLPIGSTSDAVAAYLDAEKIKHWALYYDDINEQRKMDAIIEKSSQSFLVYGDIHLAFEFDRRHRLIDYRVKEIYTGP